MSTALVSSTTLAPATARVSSVRVGDATSLAYVDALGTSVGARPGDQSVRYDERWSDLQQQHQQPGYGQQRDRTVRFGGIFVSREVGTAIMQAQAQASLPKTSSIPEAEKQIRVYEFNQSLVGTPQATTSIGIARF
ncbi:MAG: hypothetical protein HN793_13410 [Rhodospirillaceae bacterium]|jgi:hypothetical protein|nr:hypothetical protein [Rhodospirillaceae bacterium]MBT5241417.1 hypothetical protein [Rhodospirillaceae bacterium]MBT5566609.1 hypothetical protein [Rhodospirillaceae bacterium]MBT6090698.1 hypothetical protein [Rhodospirillaceae bacterium]MBT6960024.1 hypothetical protein [Rhodospirillaceae bacterium]